MDRPGEAGVATTNQWLLACGVIAGPLFVAVFLVEGATREGYNALRHPVSALALGDGGWRQIASFILTGALVVCCAVGLLRTLRAGGVAPGGRCWSGWSGLG